MASCVLPRLRADSPLNTAHAPRSETAAIAIRRVRRCDRRTVSGAGQPAPVTRAETMFSWVIRAQNQSVEHCQGRGRVISIGGSAVMRRSAIKFLIHQKVNYGPIHLLLH